MAKKKKTREQKKAADTRRESTMAVYTLAPENLKTIKKVVPSTTQPTHVILTNTYHYLAHDLRKIALFTLAVITTEIVLKLVLNV